MPRASARKPSLVTCGACARGGAHAISAGERPLRAASTSPPPLVSCRVVSSLNGAAAVAAAAAGGRPRIDYTPLSGVVGSARVSLSLSLSRPVRRASRRSASRRVRFSSVPPRRVLIVSSSSSSSSSSSPREGEKKKKENEKARSPAKRVVSLSLGPPEESRATTDPRETSRRRTTIFPVERAAPPTASRRRREGGQRCCCCCCCEWRSSRWPFSSGSEGGLLVVVAVTVAVVGCRDRTLDRARRARSEFPLPRTILDTKYGLKRWQIGEIASKIGQLYYHYYLRTSETSYLHEAYSFYAAIRGRAYYSRAAKEDRSDLMVKKLRYYARFIVVCLLLNKMKLVRELVQELDAQIADYASTYEPEDQVEWNLVLDEIKGFVKAESAVGVLHADQNPVVLTHRLGPLTSPPIERSPPMCLTLQEILIVGNCADQVKFSELSVDMFRMLQTLEREPRDDPTHLHDASPAGRLPFRPGPYPPENGMPRRDNPHKYLLYKPTYSQVQVFLASGFKELPANGALLLYLSADGCFSTVKHPEEMGYDLGGVSTSSKRDPEHGKRPTGGKEPHCLYPGDLYPFTRKPLFVVVDSDNSYVFQQIPRYFGQPLMVLMSPQETPPTLRDLRHGGSLFTLFLHAPLAAFCLICNVGSLAVHHWERCQSYVERFLVEASRLVVRSRCESSVLQFFGDDFLRLLLVRYVFCDVVLHLHRSFRGRHQRPCCHPPLPEAEVLQHPALHHIVLDLAASIDARDHFPDSNELA